LISEQFEKLRNARLSPFDYLTQEDLREKIVDLVLRDVPVGTPVQAKTLLSDLRDELINQKVDGVNVVVFGGGTGLSNLIGGDSRLDNWTQNPFCGLKEIFPNPKSIVCITDDGGSTGELLKDLPLVAIGDIRHVLLSSISLHELQKKYNVTVNQAQKIAAVFHSLFNYRSSRPLQVESPELKSFFLELVLLPSSLKEYLSGLIEYLFTDDRLTETLQRPHCLGNLIVVAAVYREIRPGVSNQELAGRQDLLHSALFKGLNGLAKIIGAGDRAVLPCTSTPAQLRVHYTNGVEIIGEKKLIDAQRGVPVERVQVDYFDKVQIFDEILDDIGKADIIIFAPGSLYSSIIPVFKVPGLAESVRVNKKALKVLISNLWVQAGETDLSIADPERKFHVSDMIKAYEKNIPGGTSGLFNEVVCVSLKDIPASVLQKYAVEGKVPIFLDREVVCGLNYLPVECGVYSQKALAERGVIQHDPDTLALAIKTLYNGRYCYNDRIENSVVRDVQKYPTIKNTKQRLVLPFQRYTHIDQWLNNLEFTCVGNENCVDVALAKETFREIFWNHPTIPLAHFQYATGISCIEKEKWDRDQRWDNVFSFFDPDDGFIKIRSDQFLVRKKLEVALMIALGESLLGNYAREKVMDDVVMDGLSMGKVYHLYLKDGKRDLRFFSSGQLAKFLLLSRMFPTDDKNHYIRLVNSGEGFTPPGLLMGLMYAWYLDNRLATHIEYKMSLMKINQSNLIPEQLKMSDRRKKMITFFREVVFAASID